MQSVWALFFTGVVFLFLSAPALGDQAEESFGAHKVLRGVVTKIESGIIFVETPHDLRTISPNKADRMGLYQIRV
ncbi:MAG: hypothetical protein ABI618_05030 [Nitrospirota bacterium]